MVGGQIYEGNKFRTSVTESARGRVDVSNLANKGVQEQLDRNKEQALVLYQQGLKLSAAQGMEEIYNNYQDNPETLKAELEKLNEKMTSEIPDMQTKVAFRTNFIIQSGSLINRAQANYDKIQYQKKKSSYFDTIQANNKSIATALNNAFNGTGTADDLVNYQTAIQQNIGLINAKNDDGTYIFSDSQRLSMSNAVDKLAAQSFSNALNDMDDDKRNQVMEALKNDSMILLQGEDEGEVKQLNLKDAFSPEVYADMKKSATILDNKIKKKQLAEYNLNKRYSVMMVNTEGGEQNYKIWEYYHPDASEDKKAQMRGIANFVPDEETLTNFDGYADAYEAIKGLSKMPHSTQAERDEEIEQATKIVQRLQLSNHRECEDGKLCVGNDDLPKLEQMINDILTDDVFRKQVSELPSVSAFQYLKQGNIKAPIMNIGRNIAINSDIDDIGQTTFQNIQNIVKSNLDADTKKREIKRIYKDGMIQAIRTKYYWIPDLQNQELIENKTILNIHGTQYLYQGIGEKMFLEIKE